MTFTLTNDTLRHSQVLQFLTVLDSGVYIASMCVVFLQMSLKESQAAQRSLESQIMSKQSSDSNRDFKLKEMEARMKAMENENKMLRQKVKHLILDMLFSPS